MSRSRKLLLTLLVVTIVVLVAASIAAQIYLAPYVKQQIEEKGSTALGAPITVGSLTIGLFPPLSANASDVQFAAPAYGAKGTIKRLSLRARIGFSFDLKNAVKDLKITIVEPNLIYDLSTKKTETPEEAAKAKDEAANSSGNETSTETIIAADVEIENGRIEVVEATKIKYLIESLNLSADFDGLGSPAELKTQLTLQAPELLGQAKLPIALDSDFIFDGTTFSTEATDLKVAELKANLHGSQNTKTGDGEWRIKAEARDFGTAGTFSDLSVKGPLTADLDTVIALIKYSPAVKSLVLAADLSRAELRYKNLFIKPFSIPLIVDARGSTEGEIFKLSGAKIIFDRLEATISASLPLPNSTTKSSSLSFSFSRTSLTGWEKFFPSLSKAPVTGFLEGAGSFEGNLQDSKTYKVSLKPLKLENINAQVDWQSQDKSKTLRGRLALNGNVDLAASSTSLQSAKADLVADLTRMQIEVKDVFSKAAATTFRTELHASQKNLSDLELKNTAVQLDTNQLIVSGTIREPQKPKLNLVISAPKISITELSNMLLAMKKYNLTGTAKGEFKLSGTYDIAGGIEKSPLVTSGNLTADIPSLKCPTESAEGNSPKSPQTSEPTVNNKAPQASPPKPEPMLPPWPIARTAVVTSKVSIKQLNCKGVAATGVNWNGTLNKGQLNGAVIIQKVFDGKLEVRSLKTNLAESQPDTEATIKTDGIDANQALTWFSPTWKDLVKGRLFGSHQVFAPDSTRPDFLSKTRAQGTIQLKNAFISTLQIDQMINKALAKLPGLGSKEVVKSKGVAATVNADYSFADAVMTLKKFNFFSPEKNEINAAGTVDINKNAKISGTAYLATAPISGALRAANSDAQGRLVLPFELNGNLMDPSVSFAEKTIQKLAENTAKKELDNLKGRAQEQGKKELEKKLEEFKKKGLKGLFGK